MNLGAFREREAGRQMNIGAFRERQADELSGFQGEGGR